MVEEVLSNPVTLSDMIKQLKKGNEYLHYPEVLGGGWVHISKDRLDSTGEQMYRLKWHGELGSDKDYEGGLVGEDCELMLSNPLVKIAKDSELHSTSEVRDEAVVQGKSTITDAYVSRSSVVTSAVLTRATIDNCIIDHGCLVTDASLKNVFAAPHVIIDGRDSKTQLTLENLVIPGYAIIDRPGQVHSLPHMSTETLSEVAVSATGEVILGGPFREPIRGRERIITYLRNTLDTGFTKEQVQENIDFVNSLTLPEKP